MSACGGVPELLLDLDVQAEEYLDEHKTPSILIYVHDPWFYPDFGSEAVKARAGHFYSVGMRKVKYALEYAHSHSKNNRIFRLGRFSPELYAGRIIMKFRTYIG